MHIIRLTATPGPDGVLTLRVPVGTAAGECEVAVVVQPKPARPSIDPSRKPTPEELGWPPGYFENTFGSITDESFVVHPQPPLPPPPEPLG